MELLQEAKEKQKYKRKRGREGESMHGTEWINFNMLPVHNAMLVFYVLCSIISILSYLDLKLLS